MTDKIKFKRMKRTILFIDGIEFDKPKHLGELMLVGLSGLCIVITSPLWIWFYLLGKLFVVVAREKEVDELHYICPNCKRYIDKIDMGEGDLYKIECI